MSMALAPARAADNDGEIALISYDKISDMVELGDEVAVMDAASHGCWYGTVIDVDDDMRMFYVKVDPDSFEPRDDMNLPVTFGTSHDLDLYEDTGSGQLFTLQELVALAHAKSITFND